LNDFLFGFELSSKMNSESLHCDFPAVEPSCKDPFSWAAKPFEKGACRYAYKGIVNFNIGTFSKGDRIVVKKWKAEHVWASEFWKEYKQAEAKAKEFAEQWNRAKLLNKECVVLTSIHATCSDSPFSRKDSDHENKVLVNEKVLIEKWLDGKFEKWNSNSGWSLDDQLSVQAFCHWTYHYSDGQYLLCDAQGTRGDDKYYITDPCILSKTPEKFGVTDLGEKGQSLWFKNHKCNRFCDKNWKKQRFDGVKSTEPIKRTSYIWDSDKSKRTNKYPNKNKCHGNKLSAINE